MSGAVGVFLVGGGVMLSGFFASFSTPDRRSLVVLWGVCIILFACLLATIGRVAVLEANIDLTTEDVQKHHPR